MSDRRSNDRRSGATSRDHSIQSAQCSATVRVAFGLGRTRDDYVTFACRNSRLSHGMAEEWIVRVQGKEYGPVDLETLHEWKREGRVLPTNEARRAGADLWTTAADIPSLFEPDDIGAGRLTRTPLQTCRSVAQILVETVRIYRKGFFQFVGLTLLTLLPSVSGQLTGVLIGTTPNANLDLRTLAAGAFGFCMLVLTIVLWPVYLAGIQILTAQTAAGRRTGFLTVLNEAVRYWPRVAGLCLFVYGVFFLLMVFAFGIAVMLITTPPSLFSALLALGLLVFQVWLFGRFFINVLFWQQFAVLENARAFDSLRESKSLARSGRDLPWFQRPMWRAAFIASIWFAFVLAFTLGPEWSTLSRYFHELTTSQDPQTLLQTLTTTSKSQTFNLAGFLLGIIQTLLRPLLGIAFVLLFLDSKIDVER